MAEAPAPPAVDTHAHVFTRAMPFAREAHSRPDYEYPVEAWLADLDGAGIERGVIAAVSLFDDGDAYTLAALAAHSRLRATVLAPLDTNRAALRDMRDLGVAGVRLTWRRMAALPDLGAEPWRGFLRRLTDCGMHIELLAGSTQLPILLPKLLDAGVTVVVDHFGVPSREGAKRAVGTEALLRAIDTGRTWVKLSAGFRLPFEVVAEVAARLLTAGPERLLWGSDAPFVNHEAGTTYPDTLDLYRVLVPDAQDRATIDRTALALYFDEGSQ
ncbi:amidohydrolase family protein [Sphingomonas sp. 3-13AW]|uniref:amidohydrolase family protein n=1 Tax=Sphingomonas sp. 3-13AW TaxID=3050450 RepID=UPI003BB636C2